MKVFLNLVVLVSIVACSSVKTYELDESKPIEIQKKRYSSVLKQDGELVDYFDLVAKLGQNPNTEYHAQLSRIYFVSSIGTAAVGSWFAVKTLTSSDDRGQNALLGLGFFAGSAFLAYLTNQTIVEGAKIYNQKFERNTSSILKQIQPQISYSEKGPYFGLSYSF